MDGPMEWGGYEDKRREGWVESAKGRHDDNDGGDDDGDGDGDNDDDDGDDDDDDDGDAVGGDVSTAGAMINCSSATD